MTNDVGCICQGNWRLIVSEYRDLIGKRYRDTEGRKFWFFGLVQGDDDYYYGMYGNDGGLQLLSCVGSIEGHGYEIVEEGTRQLEMLAYELDGVIADVVHGEGFDSVCLETIKRVSVALHADGKISKVAAAVPDSVETPSQQD